tara:strand:+ start:788 stop:1003 length:216 start_codon:yes stop_codon:yes gene_type:complete
MTAIFDSLIEKYEADILAEREKYQQTETSLAIIKRNIDRLEGAIHGVKEAIAFASSSEGEEALACEAPQPE